jgi:hypothetical protein
MLNGDQSRETTLKGWDFTCRYDRGPRCYRLVVARAAKHHGNDLNRQEIAEEVSDMAVEADVPRPSGRRQRINQKQRFGPHILVRASGQGNFYVTVNHAGHTVRDASGLFDLFGVHGTHRRDWPVDPPKHLGARLLHLFARNPGLQECGLPLRFANGMVIEPRDENGYRIPGVATYLDHTGKAFRFDSRD